MYPTTVLQAVASFAAAGALIFTAFQFRLNNRQQQENNRQQQENNRVQRETDRVRQLQLLESVFNQITELERFFHEQEARGPNENRILYEEWATLYFYRIEWLAFMIFQGFIKDTELLGFYKEEFKRWEGMFRRDAPSETQDNPKAFPYLKRIFALYNKEDQEKEEKKQ
jgi:hypothetical protein